MNRILWILLFFLVCACCRAQTVAWQETCKEARLPEGWRYITQDKAHISDRFGLGKDRLLGKIGFHKGQDMNVIYYAYYAPHVDSARKMMEKYRLDSVNGTCWKNNIPAGMGEWTVKAQGYTSCLQVDDVLYLIDDCHSTPCPYTYESQAFIRSLLDFMFREEK